jgi:hypothetical protein
MDEPKQLDLGGRPREVPIRNTFLAADEMQWLGQSVLRLNGSLEEIGRSMPSFSRTYLTYENALNEYLDLIVRDQCQTMSERSP